MSENITLMMSSTSWAWRLQMFSRKLVLQIRDEEFERREHLLTRKGLMKDTTGIVGNVGLNVLGA